MTINIIHVLTFLSARLDFYSSLDGVNSLNLIHLKYIIILFPKSLEYYV